MANITEDLNGNKTTDGSVDVNPYAATFDQIERNLSNIEEDTGGISWGKKMNQEEDSDWISLKQFLLYLTTRYVPQSLFPFVELIPILTIRQATDGVNDDVNEKGWEPEGEAPTEIKDNFMWGDSFFKDKKKLKNIKKAFAMKGANFSDKQTTGVNASNAASATKSVGSDMFNLDPFKESFDFLGKDSTSGQTIKEERNIGVRAYGQLVLTPTTLKDVPSKPGAIGFKSLEIRTGNTADMGLSLIKMVLVDVQGNKFTDLNSPWSFLYDARAQSLGGDFYFRYGWQIRVPDNYDSSDSTWNKFWNHPGWNVFDDGSSNGIKHLLQSQIVPGTNVITLTQALNTNEIVEIDKKKEGLQTTIALFDEGISFEPEGETINVSRSLLANPDNNYVRICLQNPEMDMDEHGALIATLNFRTTGAVVFKLPIEYAITTKRLLKDRSEVSLGDLLIAVQNDVNQFGFKAIQDKDLRTKQSFVARLSAYNTAVNTRNFDNFVLVQGTYAGVNGSIKPDQVKIVIDGNHQQMLFNAVLESGVSILRWFGEVLTNNSCTLLSAQTGSGAGINSQWIISTTQEIEDDAAPIKRPKTVTKYSTNDQMISIFRTEKDVFSYRFQGSLVTAMKVEKTENNNIMRTEADYNLADLANNSVTADDVSGTAVTTYRRRINLQNLFSQMLNCTIECLAHPWIGPGKRIFIKGMGFFDGEYQVTEVTHKLDGHKFVSLISATRTLLRNKKEQDGKKSDSTINGNSNFAKPVERQSDTSTNQKNEVVSQYKLNEVNNFVEQQNTTPINADSTPVESVVVSKNSGLLRYLNKDACNFQLGVLFNSSLGLNSILDISRYSNDVIKITNACLCEMRKGKGIDINWFGFTTGLSVEALLDDLDTI